MNNYKEVVKESIEKGIILDSCGEVERFYDYGRYIDLCGLDPKEIVENMQNAGGGGSSKVNISIHGEVVENNGEYIVEIKATSIVMDVITLLLSIDGTTHKITMNPGDMEATYGPVDKYCEIAMAVTPQSTAIAKYSASATNHNGNGEFNVTIIQVVDDVEKEISTKKYRYNTQVEITLDDVTGYNLIGWSNGSESGTTSEIVFTMPENDVDVRCEYEIQTFTIIWKNEDGTELDRQIVDYGTIPVYNGETPTKNEDQQYKYEFNGWSPEITEAKEDKEYTATYNSILQTYTATFLDNDGATIFIEGVKYGEKPTYKGEPEKESTEQYEYVFNGWEPSIENAITGDTSYSPTYIEQLRKYIITFVNENGNVLDEQEVEYGKIPTYNGETPTKESSAEFDYTFDGWNNEIVSVTGNATYTATYTSTKRKYIIRFLDVNGNILQDDEIEYGETPTYNGETPTKESTPEFDYVFSGWTPEIGIVTTNIDYTPLFNNITREYYVTFFDSEGNQIKQELLPYGATPDEPEVTKESTPQYEYIFKGWTPPVETVKGTIGYYPQFEEVERKYTVTWLNYDGTELNKDTNVLYGETPIYEGETPTKESTPQYEYIFSGWTPEITSITGDTVYTAQFIEETREYTVIFNNWDNTPITSITVEYGTIPSYEGETPTKDSDLTYNYTFSGWKPDFAEITGDTTYTAQFTEETIPYTITVNVENGTYSIEPEQETYTYGDKVIITVTPNEGYLINGESSLTEEIEINSNIEKVYTCDAVLYTLTLDGVPHTGITFGDNIKDLLDNGYTPQEGYSHSWVEEDGETVFTGNTMPNRDLTLTSVYEEFTESKMVYYGTDLLENIENFTIEDVLNKNKQEYDGTEQEFIFNYSGASEDIVLEYEETFDEALEEMCQQYYYIAIPSNKTVTIINAAKQEITQYFTIKNEQLIIDNTNYDQYTYRMTGVNIYPETIKLKIIIK